MTAKRIPEWLAVHEEDGVPRFRLGRLEEDIVAEWCGLATLVARRSGDWHELRFSEEAKPAERRKLERGGVKLLLRQLNGKLALHASAVELAGRALVLAGPSGRGKSTLAAALCKHGAKLVADDAVAIDLVDGSAFVTATESEHWLDPASLRALQLVTDADEGTKTPVAAPSVSGERTIPVAGIVALSWCESSSNERESVTRLTSASGVEAFGCLLPNIVRFVLDDAGLLRRELDGLQALVASVPVHVLERPRDFEQLPAVVDMLATMCLKEARNHGD